MTKRETCAWLTKKEVKADKRKKKTYCALDEVRNTDKTSFSACVVEDENERVEQCQFIL